MPYDDGIIYVDTSTDPDRGVEIADIQKVVPATIKRTVNGVTEARSSSDLGVLAGTSVGDEVPDNQGGAKWRVSSRIEINPMAKYKPVRYNKLQALTDTDFFNAHYGFGDQRVTFNANDKTKDVTWTYYKPRGGSYNEPYRDTDFNNYDKKAAPPFGFDVSGELGYPSATGEESGGVGIYFYINNTAPTQAQSGLHWREDTCLSINDLLGPYTLQNAHLGFAIHDLDKGDCATIVTKILPIKLTSSVEYIVLNKYGQDLISILDDRTRDGHRYMFVAFVVQNGPSGNKDYEAIPNSMDVYSMAFAKGIDRQTVELHYLDSIGRLTARLTNVTNVVWTRGTETENWIEYKFSCYVYGSFTTPSSGQWAVTSCGVQVRIYNPNGYVNGSEATYGTEVDVSQYNHTYNNVLLCQVVEASVKWPTQMPASERKVEISAKATYIFETKDFENKADVYQQSSNVVIS